MDGGVKLTAQDIARELLIDARRVTIDEFPDFLGIRVSRDHDQRWRGWRQPVGATTLPSERLGEMQAWVKSLHGQE